MESEMGRRKAGSRGGQGGWEKGYGNCFGVGMEDFMGIMGLFKFTIKWLYKWWFDRCKFLFFTALNSLLHSGRPAGDGKDGAFPAFSHGFIYLLHLLIMPGDGFRLLRWLQSLATVTVPSGPGVHPDSPSPSSTEAQEFNTREIYFSLLLARFTYNHLLIQTQQAIHPFPLPPPAPHPPPPSLNPTSLSPPSPPVLPRMPLRTAFKILFKMRVQSQSSVFSLYNFQLTRMYPYYFPYENSYYVPQYPPFYSDMNQIFQCYSLGQQIKVEQPNAKNEQVNTNYSINECKKVGEEAVVPAAKPQQRPGFCDDGCDFQNNVQQTMKQPQKIQPTRPVEKEQKIQQPKFRYTHKNFESNIINKIFSFLWSEDKSRSFVSRILKNKTKTALYFDYIKIIRKYCKRYINKEYLLNLCDYRIEHIAYRIVMKQTEKLKYFNLEEFSMTIRKLIFVYLDTVCTTSILTSKKMRTDIWKEHFEKMRNIRDFLFGKISAEEYDMRMTYSYKDIYLGQGQH